MLSSTIAICLDVIYCMQDGSDEAVSAVETDSSSILAKLWPVCDGRGIPGLPFRQFGTAWPKLLPVESRILMGSATPREPNIA